MLENNVDMQQSQCFHSNLRYSCFFASQHCEYSSDGSDFRMLLAMRKLLGLFHSSDNAWVDCAGKGREGTRSSSPFNFFHLNPQPFFARFLVILALCEF